MGLQSLLTTHTMRMSNPAFTRSILMGISGQPDGFAGSGTEGR